jgi:hypothetical protein
MKREASIMATREIAAGTLVLTLGGNHYVYGGPHETPGRAVTSFSLRGEATVIKCDMDAVAPVEVEASVNLKDPRISVTKQPEMRTATWQGPWAAEVEGGEGKSWHRTKRDGIETSARRLAIRDWHQAR